MTNSISPLQIMALPFDECLVLVGIHSYLGLHVLRRKVIFVDLALAQVAALGTTVAFLFGMDPLSKGAYVFSLIFTIIGAAVFSLTRLKKEKIPQEAIIGLVYALAAAIGILVTARAPHGAEHITQVLTGVLFYVKGHEVLAAAVVYSGVGLFHFIFRDKFIAISNNPEAAFKAGINVRLWDFLFYVSFGLVITHSVRTAGVLLVFIFLVVPAILAMLLTDNMFHQLLVGWTLGLVVSLAGLAVSYTADTATGPTIVALYGAILLTASLVIYVFHRKEFIIKRAIYVMSSVILVLFFSFGLTRLGHTLGASEWWSGSNGRHHHTLVTEKTTPNRKETAADRLAAELDRMDIETRKQKLSKITDPKLLNNLLNNIGNNDQELRLLTASRLMELEPENETAMILFGLMQYGESGLIRENAMEVLILSVTGGKDFGFDPWTSPNDSKNDEALRKWRDAVKNFIPG
jgi:zinc/manganese transport system permease protein